MRNECNKWVKEILHWQLLREKLSTEIDTWIQITDIFYNIIWHFWMTSGALFCWLTLVMFCFHQSKIIIDYFLMWRPHRIVGNPDYTGRSITLLIKRTSYIINGRSALSALLKCVDFGLKSTVWLTDWLTSPERCWKQSISSGHCSNDRDVCTPSGRAVRSMDHCHADIHTHTQEHTHKV